MIANKLRFTEDWTSVVVGTVIILLTIATTLIPDLPKFGPKTGWTGVTDLQNQVFTMVNLRNVILSFVFFTVLTCFGTWLMGKDIRAVLRIFPIIFVLSLLSQLVASSVHMKNLGLETVLFSLVIGLIISNLYVLPSWFREGIQSEFYIKIGLVLLGCSILFGEIMKAGALGVVQAVIVVLAVWYFAYWISRKLKVDNELSMMLASAVSICGVSAAIATAGAIKGDQKKLSYTVSLVLIVAIPMMILMPVLAKWMGLSEIITGAWIGGTIDTTGAVVASGTIAGELALKYSTIIKLSQNVLIGVAAFLITLYWSYSGKGGETAEKTTGRVIWERFPKFVLGFILASLIFSFLISGELAKSSGNVIKTYQGLWFNLAFIGIGLETRFKDLVKIGGGRPAWSFLIAQTFNIVVTLIVAYVLFNGATE